MAVDMFLKLDGIKGESQDAKHKEEIHVESFSWGLTQTGAGNVSGGSGAGKVNVHDMSITKFVDKATPDLMMCCCNGKHINTGLVTFRKAGEKPLEYIKIKLTDILVSSVQHAGHGGGDLMTESLSLNFAKFEYSYQEQDDKSGAAAGGSSDMGWDVKKNEKV